MKNFFNINKFAVIIYWVIFLALAGMFFTNDFGLVDIHKTSIITAIGIDSEGEEVKVTAEIAMPNPRKAEKISGMLRCRAADLPLPTRSTK